MQHLVIIYVHLLPLKIIFSWLCTYHPVFPKAIETELRRRLHLDSLSTASQCAAGAITTNSRRPYLKERMIALNENFRIQIHYVKKMKNFPNYKSANGNCTYQPPQFSSFSLFLFFFCFYPNCQGWNPEPHEDYTTALHPQPEFSLRITSIIHFPSILYKLEVFWNNKEKTIKNVFALKVKFTTLKKKASTETML